MTRSVDLTRVRRIWLRAPNWLGDFVMATAAFARIRAAFPAAHITVGIRPYLRPLLDGSRLFDAIAETPRAKGVRGLWQQVAAMRAGRFDLAIVLPNSLATGLVPFLAGVPLRLGYQQGRPLLMNLGRRAERNRHWWQRRRGPSRKPEPMPHYYSALLDVIGLPPGGMHPVLDVTDGQDRWVAEHLRSLGIGDGERLLLLVVGANFGASKLWVPERFGAVAKVFAQKHGLRPLVLVGPAEVELGERIAREGDCLVLSRPVLPLDKLKALVRRGALMVTGDTGPRHLAVAFDRPVVCLIGPTDANYTNYCLEHTELIRKDLDCVPCQRKVCPLGHHRCMRDITVDEVVAAGERLLARPAPASGTPAR
ncbi:MAG: lipopolysaccharide heptosyltransferase II [Planctomycetes bacterium]|nr:lipopolysaccharide heptosyltransferase II [Planctomycetota bacterium]